MMQNTRFAVGHHGLQAYLNFYQSFIVVIANNPILRDVSVVA